jgi:osmotically-inducible protein OsmY
MGTSLAWGADFQLHDAVRRQLDEDPAIRANDIAVIACDGVITLTGFVDSYAEKILAEQAVKQLHGIRALANDVDIRICDGRTDPEIARDASHALESHVRVTNRVTVIVRHGLVTLEGDVDSMSQKEAAEAAVAHLEGVKGISNRIRIAQPSTSGQGKSHVAV